MDNQGDNNSNRHTFQNDISSRTVLKEVPKDRPFVESNLKIDKVITALFLVTDIMDINEPLRIKLRDVGLNVLSDTRPAEQSFGQIKSALSLISETISLINIAKSIKLISEMNSSILVREFNSIINSLKNKIEVNNSIESILYDRLENLKQSDSTPTIPSVVNKQIYQIPLVKKTYPIANTNTKNTRKELIIKVIRDKKECTTKDISAAISDCGEKTIQRELVSLVEQGLIRKSGEKRWSKYSLNI